MKKPLVFQADLSADVHTELRKYPELALDCEMMGLNPWRDRLCVVQIAAEGGPLALVQIDEQKGAPLLKDLLEDRTITKIFHFARLDGLFLLLRLGINLQGVYCTKLASRLGRTYTDRHGLKELVREFTGNTMDKSFQTSDWGRAQLSDDQIQYAGLDVVYLFELRRRLDEILEREQRRELAQKLFDFLPARRELDRLGFDNIFEH
ncbi:MAG: ribonuclease D [Spirochaetales bacterium]|nr:ribonuclease D [Leptospiraceae bacterium]MCP5483838.1 ribonuclease D [Spirochaetales bacterium]MCP5486869.1 ribonuclease D [Spirochaetales bacterium]